MKLVHFASILVLATTITLACDDDEDAAPTGTAGSSGEAGEGNAAGKNGTAGSSSAGTAGTGTAGAGGSTADAGAGGVNDGGQDGEGLGGAAGSAGEGGLGGAGGEGGASAPEVPDVLVNGPVELIGSWKDPEFGGIEVITETTWSGSNIVGYDSGAKAVYTHNSASSFNPGKYSKYVFTAPTNDSFYFCTILYASPSLEDAKADPKVADVDKLDDKGCNGFNWTKVIKQP